MDPLKYIGDFKNGLPHGQGTFLYENGDRYIGSLEYGEIVGQGTMFHSDGSVRSGFWFKGKTGQYYNYSRTKLYPPGEYNSSTQPYKTLPNCKGSPVTKRPISSISWNNCFGIISFSNGDKYLGEWKNNLRHGQGTYTWSNGGKYVGEYKNDKQHGWGTYTYGKGEWEGDKYIGEFKDGKFHGQGTFTSVLGETYVGKYKDGKRHGHGTAKFGKGEWEGGQYVGEYKEGKFHGQGTYTYADGDKYVGEWKDHGRHGQGTTTYADGDKYVGEFKDNKRHGQGTLTWADGDKYVGKYKDGKKHGQGTYTFPDGQHVGEWKDDKAHGQGTTTYADGRVWQGQWRNGDWLNGKKYAAGEYNPPIKKKNKKQNIDPNKIINTASGSGFIVSSSGHIVTNNHVINGCNEVKIHYNGEQYKASIISKDNYNDLALLKATFTPSTVFAIKNGNAELMEDIYVAGYPFGNSYSSSVKITKGIVSSLSGDQNNFSNMQIDAALQPGNSGGPVIDFQGNVVGVAVAKLDLKVILERFKGLPENTNFAIKSSVLLNFLNSNGVKTKKASEQIMPRSELSEKITKGTLFLSCWMTYARIEEMKTQKVLFNNLIK